MTTDARVRTVCLVILTFIAGGVALYLLRPVMVPFVLALFFSYALRPVIELQVRRLRLPAGVALFNTILLGMGLLFLMGVLVSVSVTQLQSNADSYQAQLDKLGDRVAAWLPLDKLNIDPDKAFTNLEKRGQQFLVDAASALWSVVSDGILVLIFMIFLIAGHAPSTKKETGIWADIESRVKVYITTKVVVSAVTGTLVGIVLGICGVDLALVFGLFTFLLNFIPNIGSIIAALLPVPVVVLSPEISTAAAFVAILVPVAIQFVVGNVLEPRIMGTAVDLHPVTVLMALIFWGMLWGFVGMLLSTPLTATFKIALQRIEVTRPFADMLAGRRPGA